MDDRTVSLEIQERVGWIWINRPEKRNAMPDAAWQRLSQCLREADAAGVRAIIISGRGGYFAAGADIVEFEQTKATPEAARASFASVDGACHLIRTLSIPVVAGIDGYAVGAGLELAASCDIRIATQGARLGITASKMGITPGYGHIARLWELVGTAHALDLLLTGRLITAQDGWRMGLVTEVVESSDLLWPTCQRWAAMLAERAPLTVRWVKQAIRSMVFDGLMREVTDDAGEATLCYATEDFHEAVQAFRERRSPTFRGR
jgi:enoyl-CoA hydratase